MLFNSPSFLLLFLPAALLGFHVASRFGRTATACWLILASLAFYGAWNPSFLALLLLSIGLNHVASRAIATLADRPRRQTAVLAAAVACNLAVLAYYKYVAALLGVALSMGVPVPAMDTPALPLGISFFTFTQIGFLVDTRLGTAKERGFLNYVLFVTFFPHLIAGPILHHREIMPQFADSRTFRLRGPDIVAGLSIFVLGLAKKCLLADPLAAAAAAGFGAPHGIGMVAAWDAALCFSLQLYFDFSGYSDMAIGLARLFNVRFPANFDSPYKATSIIDHWQRWHITLSRYLGLYVYGPLAMAIARARAQRGLGTSRAAQARPGAFAAMVLGPTLVTMGLAGVWHGAGAQFMVFGLLHGTYLSINHAWRLRFGTGRPGGEQAGVRAAKVLLTYLAVLVASVFFRASSVGSALALLAGMAGLNGIGFHGGNAPLATGDLVAAVSHAGWIAVLFAVVWGMPNTQQIMSRAAPTLGRIVPGGPGALLWRPNRSWAVAIGCAGAVAALAMSGTSEFLYYQF